MKILICVPCMDMVPAQFAQSLAMLQKPEGMEIELAFQMSSLIYDARNQLAKTAMDREADFLMWFDSDMVFSPFVLVQMMKHFEDPEVNIVTGVYYRRKPPYTPVLFDKLEFKTPTVADWHNLEVVPSSGNLFEVAGCGFGIVLMRTDVVFDVMQVHGNMFGPIGNTGEDLSFCWRARQCGFTVLCDPNVKAGHCGQVLITEEWYNSYRAAEGG